MENFQIEECEYVAVVGGGHGIGLALVERMLSALPKCHVFASYRREEKAQQLINLQSQYPNQLTTFQLDPVNEHQLENWSEQLSSLTERIDLVINCVGMLHDDQWKPEKSLRSLSFEQLAHYFAVNSAVTPVLAKHLLPLLKHKKLSMLVTLSAKVGSISDNRIGGWYGYRASKAALNMLLKTLSIEFTNRKTHCIALSLHPGTTATELSEPYTSLSKVKSNEPSVTAANLLRVLDGKTPADSGKFFSWDNTEIEW